MPEGEDRVQKQGRVLFVASVYEHFEAFHLPYIQLLHSWGFDVHATAAPAGAARDRVQAAGVVCRDIHFARSPARFSNIRAYQALRQLLSQERWALIHCHTPMAAWLGRLAARRTGQGPVLYTAHGLHFYRGAPWLNWLVYYPAEKLAARWTDGLIVMNAEDFARAQGLGFEPGTNLFFVHGVGVDLDRHAPDPSGAGRVRAELGIPPGDPVITCVAEMNRNKNQRLLLSAWPLVHEEVPNAHLLLVGGGPLRDALQEKVVSRGLRHVHILGFRPDVPAILQATDVAVLVSKREGLPRFVMEAMAATKPVVATDVRGNRDLLQNGKSGILLSPEDSKGLAGALVRLLGDDAMRRRIGAAGRTRIEQYALPRLLGEMEDIYRRYLNVPVTDAAST